MEYSKQILYIGIDSQTNVLDDREIRANASYYQGM